MYFQAFPDMSVTVDEMVAEGETVTARMTIRGTHQGEFMGVAATGRQINLLGVDVVHFSNGKATEVWHFDEEMVMWQQLGVAPPMG